MVYRGRICPVETEDCAHDNQQKGSEQNNFSWFVFFFSTAGSLAGTVLQPRCQPVCLRNSCYLVKCDPHSSGNIFNQPLLVPNQGQGLELEAVGLQEPYQESLTHLLIAGHRFSHTPRKHANAKVERPAA